MATQAPLHTIDGLRAEIANGGDKTGIAGNTFLSVDCRVLTWLLDDAARMNTLEAAAIAAGHEHAEDAFQPKPTGHTPEWELTVQLAAHSMATLTDDVVDDLIGRARAIVKATV